MPRLSILSATLIASALLATPPAFADDTPLSEAELGELLFFDPSFSKNRSQSCATCHDPDQAFTDGRQTPAFGMVSLGDDGAALGVRNAPTAAYALSAPPFHYDEKLNEYVGGQFHDGRADTLAIQATQPPLNPVEMMMPDPASVVSRIRENDGYVAAFEQLYGKDVFAPPADPKAAPAAFAAFGQAIEAFERTPEFAPYDSKYDRFLRGEYDLTVLEDLGRTLFFSNDNVNCSTCHMLKREDAENEPFTNHQYRNIGVPRNPALIALGHVAPDYVDHGLLENPAVTDPDMDGRFKTPTLRNVAVTGPYMHNGVFKDLRTVLEFYDKFNNPERKLNPETGKPWAEAEVPATVAFEDLGAQALTDRKIDALEAFLKTLTDKRYEPLLEDREKAAD
ncbi:cytochrome-c peroxidase [Rhodalgimonas zhirmunskyi]|uniref:Methylamine utilization protein MauG n=1 Tax=Rhodalgimonas zhirmunskyi TaxID=2964767 RepID=A0AAJ1UBV7_9RHOB|nr:cytochrome c peroxidase [Rhodoalgimonas zhirmunskyi]MDQ2093716.1 methylamine utilization protein MauG [Rhodoalgimonas zhirmunskyi]